MINLCESLPRGCTASPSLPSSCQVSQASPLCWWRSHKFPSNTRANPPNAVEVRTLTLEQCLETALKESYRRRKIARLRELGICVSIDDFGSGYSSFSDLEKLPVAAIKVDHSFIECMDSEPRTASVVKGMVTMDHSIGCA
jgi:sensor c-di-GMP phosphodiesterase-like protein